jgi:hypothetical protein
MPANSVDSRDYAAFKLPLGKSGFHFSADAFPFFSPDSDVDPAIGNYFNVAVGEEQVNEHAVVMLGIPDMEVGKYLYRAFASRLIFKQRQRIQRRLYRETNFPSMAALRFFDSLFDSRQGSFGKCAPYGHMAGKKMAQYPSEIHSPSPGCAAAAKPAATSAEATATTEAATSATKTTSSVPTARASSIEAST